jgi:hypothetical protein
VLQARLFFASQLFIAACLELSDVTFRLFYLFSKLFEGLTRWRIWRI